MILKLIKLVTQIKSNKNKQKTEESKKEANIFFHNTVHDELNKKTVIGIEPHGNLFIFPN